MGYYFKIIIHKTRISPILPVDCYVEDDDKIVAIELKTVKPNSGVFKNEKEKILSAKAGLKNLHPTKEIYFYLGFPFDPISNIATGSDTLSFMRYSVDFKKYFDPAEVLLANGLWDFLSEDTDTMQQILNIINSIATTQFIQIYEFLNITENRVLNKEEYIHYLTEWRLFSEINLINSESLIQEKIVKNKRLTRIFNQPIFKDGKYNIERKNFLKEIL